MKYFFPIEEERAVDFIFAAHDVGISKLSSTTSNGITTFVLNTSPAEAVRRMHEAYTNPETRPTSNERDAA